MLKKVRFPVVGEFSALSESLSVVGIIPSVGLGFASMMTENVWRVGAVRKIVGQV